jgi:hypothetical protein
MTTGCCPEWRLLPLMDQHRRAQGLCQTQEQWTIPGGAPPQRGGGALCSACAPGARPGVGARWRDYGGGGTAVAPGCRSAPQHHRTSAPLCIPTSASSVASGVLSTRPPGPAAGLHHAVLVLVLMQIALVLASRGLAVPTTNRHNLTRPGRGGVINPGPVVTSARPAGR